MAIRIKSIDKNTVGQNVTVGGVISKVQKVYLKSQQMMLFATIEGIDGNIELLVFPKVLERLGSVFEEEKVIIATGRVSDKDGQFKILTENAKVVDQKEVENFKRIAATQKKNGVTKNTQQKIIISLPSQCGPEALKKLSNYFDTCERGNLKIILDINNTKLETPYCVKKIDGMERKLKDLIPEGRISIL